MARGKKRWNPTLASKIYIWTLGSALLVALVVAVVSLGPEIIPSRTRVDLSRSLRPGAHETRIPWTRSQAVDAVSELGGIVAAWDTFPAPESFTIHARLDSVVPLEEGNRLLAAEITRRGIEIIDAIEEKGTKNSRHLRMAFGLDGRPCGDIRLEAFRHSIEPETGPAIAFVVDDFGFQPRSRIEAFLKMDVTYSAAVLPGYKNSEFAARLATDLGRDVILHVPMEPKGYPRMNPGKNAILVNLSESEIRSRLGDHLDDVPGAIGVSNHMGSMATQDVPTMRAVLGEVGRRGMFFFDSRTTGRSVAARVARELSVSCVTNDLFLDRDLEPEKILARFEQLV